MPKILMIHPEPTPYLIDLINVIHSTFKGQIDILFLNKNVSQNWNLQLEKKWMILPKKNTAKIRLIFQLIFKKKYDVIHFAGWGNILLLLCIALTKFTRVSLVVESDTPISHHAKFWKKAIKRLVYPALFRQFKIFLPGGTKQAKYFEHYGVKSEHIIPMQMTVNTVEIRRYTKTLCENDRQKIREHYEIGKNKIVFLYVGRLVAQKGIGDLISVFNKIENENSILLIVGDGPLRHQVENTIKINKKIRYVGRLSGKELIKIYCIADTLVLPSHLEPWGLVVNEAMATGLPVIVSDQVGCVEDLVSHQVTGLVVKAGCLVELKCAIEDMAISPTKRIKMGKYAIEKISDWTLENAAKKVCQAWDQLVRT